MSTDITYYKGRLCDLQSAYKQTPKREYKKAIEMCREKIRRLEAITFNP